MNIFFSNSPEETINIAKELSTGFSGGEVIAFRGDLGAGKTHFTKGIALGVGYNGTVNSPTFALINEYLGGRLNVYHFDMYRISSWDELYSSGFFEYIELQGVVVVEWSENIENALPDNTIYIEIENIGETERKITVSKKEES